MTIAQDVLYSSNFEGFDQGDLFGQDQWTGFLVGTNFQVDAGIGRGWSNGVIVHSSLAQSAGWAFRDLRTEGTGTIVARVNVLVAPLGEFYSRFGLDAYGVDGPTGSNNFGRIAVLTVAGDGSIRFFGSDNTAVPGISAPPLGWHRLALAIDFDSGTTTAAIDGIQIDRVLPIPSGKTYLSDVDLYVSPVGFDDGTFDDYLVERYSSSDHAVAVPIALSGVSSEALPGTVAEFTLVDEFGATVGSDQSVIQVGPYAEMQFPGVASGTYRLYAQTPHSLRRYVGDVSFGQNAAFQFGMPANLINGDVIADNVIDPSDYFALSESYGTSAGDLLYSDAADLNRDGQINESDYFILSDAYDIYGD